MSTPLRRHRSDEADRALRDAQQTAADALAETVRLRRALDALTSAIVIHDARGQLVLRNRQHAELDANRQVSALVAAAVDQLVATAQEGQAATQTLELHGPPPRALDITAVPLGTPDVPLGTIAVVEDISERRRLEAVRRDFAANVSHELRTPIGALGVLAETLVDEDDPAVVRRLARHILSEAERAGRLIEDLLDLSRIEAGGVPVDTAVDTGAVVAAAAERVAALAAQRHVHVHVVATAPDEAWPVVGDERQLVSALVNLLDNAIKYSEPGSVVELDLGGDQQWVDVTVRDQGIGIPAKDLERIFERFYRVDRARSRETGGTGLGLSIVRHVATNHGGAVDVASREGEGSTFTLRLPRAGPPGAGR
jgi:two-component system sensor histidine kinase SenX3